MPTNVPDCTFEVESCVDMSTLIKKIIIDDIDSDISKFESCESVEIDSSEGH